MFFFFVASAAYAPEPIEALGIPVSGLVARKVVRPSSVGARDCCCCCRLFDPLDCSANTSTSVTAHAEGFDDDLV